MITKQEYEIQQKAQAASAVIHHRSRNVLLAILGVALPLVAGSMLWWPWEVQGFRDSGYLYSIELAGAVTVTVGAFLLCFALGAWWVGVFAGLAWVVGEVLGLLVHTLVEGGWSALQTQYFWIGQVEMILYMLVLLVIGVVIGSGLAIMSNRS